MIDLGRWASEEYRVPLVEDPQELSTDSEYEEDRRGNEDV
jgi:Domain of unknown function (DUF329).